MNAATPTRSAPVGAEALGGFLLGSHQPSWLELVDFPLFVSHHRLAGRRTLPRARTDWALDSGGFTALKDHGTWTIGPDEYIAAVRRYRDEIGQLRWAAPQDWMCEPLIINGGTAGGQRFVGTKRTVAEHQRLTIENFVYLADAAPDLPFIPVLQGWTLPDYLCCITLYERAGVRLADYPLVGLGSVCRRQATSQIGAIVATLADTGLNLHGFGVKTRGLARYGADLTSSDSMAWSFAGRWVRGCSPTHKAENNCLTYATAWRARSLAATACAQQALPFGSQS